MDEEELIPVPVPALVAVLLNKETAKGSPLTESEVIEIRDNAACMMMPRSIILTIEQSRGYPDIDPENVWAEWLAARLELISDQSV